MKPIATRGPHLAPVPTSVLSRNPLTWLAIFGPGAIVASLTIGTGELIFSTRAGALFGVDILWFFVLILLLKWVLVFASARHMCVSGAHPFSRYMELPGPRGWFPLVLMFFMVLTNPVWAAFLAHTTGTLLTVTPGESIGSIFANATYGPYVWGGIVFTIAVAFAFLGGYQLLEKAQLLCVFVMLVCAFIALVILNPDYLALLKGLFVPTTFEYPPWLSEKYPEDASKSIWLETITYAGVLGGAGFDYLVYVVFLREKSWGFSGHAQLTHDELNNLSPETHKNLSAWLRAPLMDCTISFAVVLFFSIVFVSCGLLVLGPEQKIPEGNNLLNEQAEFFRQLHEWFVPVYIVGAIMTLGGSVYCTLEVGPHILCEMERAFTGENSSATRRKRIRRAALTWNAVGGALVIWWSTFDGLKPVDVIKPVNLFTGVLNCGFVALLNPWMDWKFLPRSLRMPRLLMALNLAAGVIFIGLGIRSYWDYGKEHSQEYGGLIALGILAGTLVFGWIAGWIYNASRSRKQDT